MPFWFSKIPLFKSTAKACDRLAAFLWPHHLVGRRLVSVFSLNWRLRLCSPSALTVKRFSHQTRRLLAACEPQTLLQSWHILDSATLAGGTASSSLPSSSNFVSKILETQEDRQKNKTTKQWLSLVAQCVSSTCSSSSISFSGWVCFLNQSQVCLDNQFITVIRLRHIV